LVAIVAVIGVIGIPVMTTPAGAARARCVAFCNGWCEKNHPRKNLESCSEICQAKHCH